MKTDTPRAPVTDGVLVRVTDVNKVWQSLRIAGSIPLGRLEWTWTGVGSASLRESSTSARAIFHPSSSAAFEAPRPEPNEWFRNPYVYVYIVTIPSLEKSHDNIAWAALRSFVDSCRQPALEYIVILAATDEQVVHNRKVVDRLRQEVNFVAHRERVVVVPPAIIKEEELRPITHLHHSPAHRDLLLRLRECVRDAVNTRVKAYDDTVSRSFLNRTASGWSYGSFFALKEGMGFVFQQLGRRDLSVKFYDELHTLLLKQPRPPSLVFCNETAAEAARGLSDPTSRDYRDRLLDGTISELDIQTYLFARQMSLLLLDHKYTELAEKGLKLITSIANRCAQLVASPDHPTITSVFRDTWVFVAARSIADSLAPSVPQVKEVQASGSAQLGTSRERHAVRLVAGFHVHALRAFSGLAHVALPGCLGPKDPADDGSDPVLVEEASSTSHKELRDALSNKRKAEMLYSEIANAAASLYEMGGRARGAAALDGDAGIAHLRNGSFRDAEALLSAQCLRFSNDHGWDELHRRQRRELAKAEKEMDRIQEYLVSCLTMLYMGRSSRLLYSPNLVTEEEKAEQVDESKHWVKEATTAASRLPRVMRYKADRLFFVSVLPNEEMWEEGNPGKVTVRIKSDIPAPITLDSISVELRLSDVPGPPKSALRNREEDNVSSSPMGEHSRLSESASPTASPLPGNDSTDVMTLRSERGVVINPGKNDVEAHVNEIPVMGRYRISIISLYLGNLKIVQQPNKSPVNLIVTRKGTAKPTVNPNASTGVTDVGASEAQFPFFFAAARKLSASLEVEENTPFYLAPNSRQYINVTIRGLERGIAGGATLTCSLLIPPGTSRTQTSGSFVRFCNSEKSVIPDGKSEDSEKTFHVFRVQRTRNIDKSMIDIGEAIIDKNLTDGEDILVKIGLDVLCSDILSAERQADIDADMRSCILRVDFAWHEVEGNTRRERCFMKETTLQFVSPLSISARIELNSEWGAENVSRGVALDGTPLGEGGTLVCSVTSQVRHDSGLRIRKMVLEPPKWLELRPDEEPGHMTLLPCELREGAVFVVAFDVFTREGFAADVVSGQIDRREVYGENAAKRRMSRRAVVDSSGEIMELQEGIRAIDRSRRTEDELSVEQDEEFVDAQSGFLSSVDGFEARDEEEVLDLVTSSDGIGSRGNDRGGSPGNGEVESTATFHVDVEISGMAGTTTISRRISMESMRVNERRYGIERRMKSIGESGKIMELEFDVREIGARNYDASDESGVLQYEVDADPAVWVVVGRRRGKIGVGSNGGQGAGRAELVPISCGRHGVPCIRLFEHDGRAMAWSRYENVNEYMHLIVMPCRTVVSGCHATDAEGTAALSKNDIGEDDFDGGPGTSGAMPVVIASDLFFGS